MRREPGLPSEQSEIAAAREKKGYDITTMVEHRRVREEKRVCGTERG